MTLGSGHNCSLNISFLCSEDDLKVQSDSFLRTFIFLVSHHCHHSYSIPCKEIKKQLTRSILTSNCLLQSNKYEPKRSPISPRPGRCIAL